MTFKDLSLALFSVTVMACAHAPQSPQPAQLQLTSSIVQPVSCLRSSPGQQKSRELWALLQKLRFPTAGREHFRLFDLTCAVDQGQNYCEYRTSSRGPIKKIKGAPQEDLENLRGWLSEYPVDQGEPGASTRFVECEKQETDVTCYMAINLSYEGP